MSSVLSKLVKSLVIILVSAYFLAHADAVESCWQDITLVMYPAGPEGERIAGKMKTKRREMILGRPVISGYLAGKRIILAETGEGTTNAAMTTQKLIDTYNPNRILMTGIAGAVNNSVSIGDIVVCRTWRQHDYGYIGKDGFKPEAIIARDNRSGSIVKKKQFDVDSTLFDKAGMLSDGNLSLDQIGDRAPRILVEGVGVTGNTFVDDDEKRLCLLDTFDAMITDMESVAVAQVSTANLIPFLIFRSASDLAGGSGSSTAEKEIKQFFEVAADNSSKVLEAFIKEL